MNKVLSIRPSKIGTPICMHFVITSRRCIPASRANSVGVKWIAIRSPPAVVCSVRHVVPDGEDGANSFSAISALESPADLLGDPFAGADSAVHVAGPVVGSLSPGPVNPADRRGGGGAGRAPAP